jgi:nucleotide-binding universal stress UspA family protein
MPGKIVVGVDGSTDSDAALAWACEEAALRGAVVDAVYVIAIPWQLPDPVVDVPTTEPEREAAKLLDAVLARVDLGGAVVERRILEGDAVELLAAEAKDAELLVVGSHVHGAVSKLFGGSVTGDLAKEARCPVVLVRAAGRGARR